MSAPFVDIVVLNYDGWRDTVACVRSLERSSHRAFRIIVVDNASTDDSWSRLLEVFGDQALVVERPDAPREGAGPRRADLVLLRSPVNGGFAAGNNLGMRYALETGRAAYIWLLNNDTEAAPDALAELVAAQERARAAGTRLGLLGAKLLERTPPGTLQGVGGRIHPWLGTTSHVGQGASDDGRFDRPAAHPIDYPIGASLMFPAAFVRDVGPLCEDYFLYYEEIDWVRRGAARGWSVSYCPSARVTHAVGAAAGSSDQGHGKSRTADFYGLRSRILFMRRFHPRRLWLVRASFLLVALRRCLRFQFDRLPLVLRAMRGREGDRL